MKLKKQFRMARADGVQIDPDTRTAEFSFSSELPVDRYFGREILDHGPGSADLTRVNDGAPLLWNHDSDQVLGVVESAEIRGDKRGYARVRFSHSAFAQEKLKDVQDGILRNVSFGYQIDQMEESRGSSKDDVPTFVAKKWLPFEISIVSIPADQTVGFGRAEADEAKEVEIITQPSTEISKPTNEENRAMEENKNLDIKIKEATDAERTRSASILALGEKHGQRDLARQLIDNGAGISEARAAFLEKLSVTQKPVVENAAMIDLSEKDNRSYSLLAGIRAQVSGDWKEAGLERELSLEIAKRMGKETTSFFMPLNVRMNGTRSAYNTGSATAGGNLVANNLEASSFIELLRNNMLMMQLGARVLSGLSGNITIPKQTGSSQAYWVAEGADVPESEGTLGNIAMSPKTVGARSQITRQMLIQSTPSIEMLVRSDLAQVLALAIDKAAISGSGTSGQPTGILNQAGIGQVAMGANGGAFASGSGAGAGIDPLIDLETLVATSNADFGSLAYITNAVQVGHLKKLKSTTGEYLWNGYQNAVSSGVPGEINGYKVGRTNQVPSTLTKGTSSGNCSAMIFGNFNDLIIAQFGPGIEVLANPFGAGYNSGSLDLRALASVDVNVRNPISFAAITDLL